MNRGECKHCGGSIPAHKRTVAKFCSPRCLSASWRAANQERVRNQARAHYAANADKVNARSRRWRAENLEKSNASARKWQAANPERVKSASMLRRYGISLDQYREMLLSQGSGCAICGSLVPAGSGSWHVDHDHDTGVVRGLLCAPCNLGLGSFKDNPDRLARASVYVRDAESPGAECAFGATG